MRLNLLLITFLLLAITASCPANPNSTWAERTRAQYQVILNNYHIEPLQGAGATAPAEGASVSAETVTTAVAENAAPQEDESEAISAGRSAGKGTPADVMLKLFIRFDGDKALSGVTVDIDQLDSSGKSKSHFLRWVETSGIKKGEVRQVKLSLDEVMFEDGDEFVVEWNAFVPPEKRGEYREFSETESR